MRVSNSGRFRSIHILVVSNAIAFYIYTGINVAKCATAHVMIYRVPAVNLTLNIFGTTSSHIYPTGQNEVPLEPQRPHEDFGVSHAQIKQSLLELY